MGGYFSKKWISLTGLPSHKIVMIGPKSSGKTTLLYKLKLGETVPALPTLKYNVEKLTYKDHDFNIWDLSGGYETPLWRGFYEGVDGVIFVIDAADKGVFDLIRRNLKDLLDEPLLRDVPILVFANKQDLPNAIRSYELSEILCIKDELERVNCQDSVSFTGDGLYEGLEFLYKFIS